MKNEINIDTYLDKYKILISDKSFNEYIILESKKNLLNYYNSDKEDFVSNYCLIDDLDYKISNFSLSKSYRLINYYFSVIIELYHKEEVRYLGYYKLMLDYNLICIDDSLSK